MSVRPSVLRERHYPTEHNDCENFLARIVRATHLQERRKGSPSGSRLTLLAFGRSNSETGHLKAESGVSGRLSDRLAMTASKG